MIMGKIIANKIKTEIERIIKKPVIDFKKIRTLSGEIFRVFISNGSSLIVKLIDSDISPSEIEIYRDFLRKENIPSPKYIGSSDCQTIKKKLLLLEDVGSFNTRDSLKFRLRLAMQAAHWHKNTEKRIGFYQDIFPSFTIPQKRSQVVSWFRGLDIGLLDRDVLAGIRNKERRFLALLPILVANQDTFEHNDLHKGNVKIGANGKIEAVIDWEGARRGSGLSDLVRIANIGRSINDKVIFSYLRIRKIENFDILFKLEKVNRFLELSYNIAGEIKKRSQYLNRKINIYKLLVGLLVDSAREI